MDKRIAKLTKQARGLSASELNSEIEFARREMAATPSERNREAMTANLAIFEAEVARRQQGGKQGADVRQPYMTDGERAAAGLADKDDNL